MSGDFIYVDEPISHVYRRREIAAKHPEVRALISRNPSSALWIVGLVGAQWLVASQADGFEAWVFIAVAFLFGAFINHALYVMIHECTHALVFKSQVLNRLFAILCDFALVLPSAMGFRKFHLHHHRYLGQYDMDPDIVSHREAQLIGNSAWRKAAWVALLPVSQALRPMKLKAQCGVSLWDGWVIGNLIAVLVVDTLIYLLLGPAALGYLALSTLFALGLHPLGGRWIQEHHVTAEGQDTYSYYGPLNKLCFNMGYHNEHHDFPAVPWNKLPQLRAIAPESYNNLKSYDSWIGVLRHFIFDRSMSAYSRMVHPSTVPAGAAVASSSED